MGVELGPPDTNPRTADDRFTEIETPSSKKSMIAARIAENGTLTTMLAVVETREGQVHPER